MRTESKDLSAAKYKNSLPLEWKMPRRSGIRNWRYERQLKKAERCATHVRENVSP